MVELYNKSALECSKLITNLYSTSFTLGIKTLHKQYHYPVYAIYGFVRYADEIVDTFHDHNKKKLLADFKIETYKAIEQKVSFNPVLHSFQLVVNEYQIEHALIEAFLKSMEMDLDKKDYNEQGYQEYIHGSAEVVGLMCLRVFCKENPDLYNQLLAPAKSLGSAFQKVNFLRDIKSDYEDRGRVYFPGVDFTEFSKDAKKTIEDDIQRDFDHAYQGIIRLPDGAKMGVYLAYIYYLKLFRKIKNTPATVIQHKRIRVPDAAKIGLLVQSYFRYRLNYL